MNKFKVGDTVIIRAVPAAMARFRKSLGKLVGKTATVTFISKNESSKLKGYYYNLSVDSKEFVFHELNLEPANDLV